MSGVDGLEHFDTVVVGAGQAGLAVGYHLAKAGQRFVILDANDRVGDSWRKRWDSLRLFTPARYSSLPGWRFPGRGWSYPTKDEVADYLEAYATRFDLPVRTGITVTRLTRESERFIVVAGGRRFEAAQVVVASGAYHTPRIPAFAHELDPKILQLHSSEYRDPSQLREGSVLVVGAGNSGAEIAYEVARAHETWLSGRDTGRIPVRTGSVWDRLITPPFWLVASHVLTTDSPIGRRIRPQALQTAGPLERVRQEDLAAAGIERVSRTTGVQEGLPLLEDGRTLDVANVIWCTGFRPTFRWIELPVFANDGEPIHDRGIVKEVPGLYFVGRFFLYGFTSALLGGVGRDAEHISRHALKRVVQTRPASMKESGAKESGAMTTGR